VRFELGALVWVLGLSLLFSQALGAEELATASGVGGPCQQFVYRSQLPLIVNPKLRERYHVLCFSAFVIGYSGVSKTPLWSAEHLTRESLNKAKELRRLNAFHEELALEVQERSFLSDYARSGFDRGHMSPSADQPTELAQQESFSLANMVPQNSTNNRHIWEGIESATRSYARRSGEVFVITGPLFMSSTLQQLKGRVLVPSHLFKILYDPIAQGGAAYLVRNEPTEDYAVISLSQLSKLAGIDFLPALPEHIKSSAMALPAPREHAQTQGSGGYGRSGWD
jgi:endonuclease G